MRLNNRGQFSIIAALLVAIVVIATVVTTYATIRYDTVADQPQVLSAVDETNLALKRLLGFTVGYYGSILQVTGNMSYAQILARNYLQSGLENIADIKPEWGLSFNVNNLTLQVDWFMPVSYSKGNFTITYNLAGLGFYNLTYTSQSDLNVHILADVGNEARISVNQEDGEPLTTLTKSSFKFYSYDGLELTWNLIPPTVEPVVFANGTYSVNIPSGIDNGGFLVLVEDARGLITIASSFSTYTSTISWSSIFPTLTHYVDQLSTLYAPPDIGSHSNFELQKSRDGNNDTLSEQDTRPASDINHYIDQISNIDGSSDKGSHGNFEFQKLNDGSCDGLTEALSITTLINCESFEGSWPPSGWSGTGNWNKESDQHHTGSYSADFDGPTSYGSTSGDLTTGTLDCSNTAAINVDFWYFDGGVDDTEFVLQFYDGASWNSIAQLGNGAEGSWLHYTQRITDSQYFNANFRVRWAAVGVDSNEHAYVDDVTITKEPTVTVTLVNTESFEGSWPPSGWSGTGNWNKESDQHHTGSYSADFDGPTSYGSASGDLTTGTLPCSDAAVIDVDFWYHDGGVDDGEFVLQFYDGGSWHSIAQLGNGAEGSWIHYLIKATDSQYFKSNFQVRWAAVSVDVGEHCYVDDVTITKEIVSYQLDLEEQFTNVDFSKDNEYLLVYTGSLDSENLRVQFWNGINWTTLISALSPNSLANVSISEYLTGSPFTIRFVGAQESGDPTPSLWYVDCVLLQTLNLPKYELDLEEQFTSVDYSQSDEQLCVCAGPLSSEPLSVDVYSGSSWVTLIPALQPNQWNNVSISTYLVSPTFTIRFKGTSEVTDTIQDSWMIDAVMVQYKSTQDIVQLLPDSTIVVEWLQNGTIRWLGESLQLETTSKPIPPLPVKAFHLNQTINGVNQEVPFQVEDWASFYRVPLALTSNATVFNNRQMLVFLLNTSMSGFTLWWDGRDIANQTSYAFVNRYFTNDNPETGFLSNGILNLNIEIVNIPADNANVFRVNSTTVSGLSKSTAKFMRINTQNSTYGAAEACVIHHGVVRDVVQQEAEWGGGANNCPNVYANIVLTLPAGASYYTYQLRLMFIDSAPSHPRVITDLCPIQLSSPSGSPDIMTENGTAGNTPIVVNGTGTFVDYGSQTAHHWSQFISGQIGTGIMFTTAANQQLYAFDAMAGGATGALNVSSVLNIIDVAPVTSVRSVPSFTTSMDLTWQGAVATFDATRSPIYRLDAGKAVGLWILVEYPPQLTVTAET